MDLEVKTLGFQNTTQVTIRKFFDKDAEQQLA